MTLLILVHLLGLTIGFLTSGVSGVILVGGLLRGRISHERFSTIKRCTELDIIALAMTLATGATLLVFDAHASSWGPKLWARAALLLVVSCLAISAKKFMLPLLERNLERSLSGVPVFVSNRRFLYASRVLASFSWLGLIALTLWQSESIEALAPVMVLYSLGSIFCGLVSPWLSGFSGRLPQGRLSAAIKWVLKLAQGASGGDARDCEAVSREILRQELNRASTAGETLTVATLHSESLHEVRERYGGMAAEQFEKEVHSLILSRLRDMDITGSLGRGKYLLILPSANEVESDKVVKRLGRALDEYRFDVSDYAPSPGAESIHVVFKLKVIAFKPSTNSSPESVLEGLTKANATLQVLELAS